MFGIYVAAYINTLWRKYRYSYLAKLAVYMSIISVLFAIIMFAIYFRLNLPGDFILNRNSLAGSIISLVSYILVFILMYLMFLIAMELTGRSATVSAKIILIIVLIAASIIECLNIFSPDTLKAIKILDLIFEYLIDNLVLLEVFFLIYIVRKGHRLPDLRLRKVVMNFGYLFLLRYVILILGYFIITLSGVSTNMIFVSQIFIFPSLILLPFLWVRLYFLKYVQTLSSKGNIQPHLDNICLEYGISGREKEIILLMIRGKTNKEIEDELFISINTVKNHVYNIFKKLKIKSRHQLIRFFTQI